MTFQVEITSIAEAQIEQAYRWYQERNPEFADRWFRGLMDTIATLQEKPQRCALAVEHKIIFRRSTSTSLWKSQKYVSSAFYDSGWHSLCVVCSPQRPSTADFK
jgi:plasmid stabilization system protein ParE